MSDRADRLADAVIELLVADGFEGISIRRVAAAAGVSIGAVQHHFPTKDAMVDAAMRRVSERFQARIDSQLGTLDDDPMRVLSVIAEELLGVGTVRRDASVIWLQRLARAAVDPAVAAEHTNDWLKLEELLGQLIALCRPDRSQQWHRDRAGGLLALLDGLAAAVVTEPSRMPADRAERLLAVELERLSAQS